MAIGNRYNGGGPLQGVVIEGQIDPATGQPVSPSGGSSNPSFAKGATYNFLGHQQILTATLASSTALPSVPAAATTAFIQNIGTAGANLRIDGATTAPTASGPGIVIAPGVTFTCDFGQTALTTARVIQVAAGAALQITYMA